MQPVTIALCNLTQFAQTSFKEPGRFFSRVSETLENALKVETFTYPAP